ncbi:MAG: hypothetical protein IT381_11520 [Deltaproteobacteria bacterium]|nr:hypothetical protein [Deltaproteobacteria bacterium]
MIALVAALIVVQVPLGGGQRPASACEKLFGTAEQKTKNASRRAKKLHHIREDDYAVDVTYSGDWKVPGPIRFHDVTLAEVLPSGAAVIQVATPLAASAGCSSGRYEIKVDDKIGRKNVVLAILSHAVLIERSGQLYYLAKEELDPNLFRMTWRADFRLPRQWTSSTAAPRPPNQPVRR